MEIHAFKLYEDILSISFSKIDSELGKKNQNLKEIIAKCQSFEKIIKINIFLHITN
jgi:hypothetical protein